MASARRTLAVTEALDAGLVTAREALEVAGVEDEATLRALALEAARQLSRTNGTSSGQRLAANRLGGSATAGRF